MKICAISDLHGFLPEIEECEILLIAGDISPLSIQFNKPEMKKWLELHFAYWIKSLPVKRVFLVAGNHDFYFQNINNSNILSLEQSCEKLVYINNKTIHYYDENCKLWSIFGTPYCSIFGNWPFMRSDEILIEKFKEIPEKVDIIISHDPPHGVGQVDQILGRPRWNNEELEHVGNIPLRERLNNTEFKLLVCGHIHSGDHEECDFNNGKVVNVSVVNEQYKLYYKPFYIEL
jgi:Icc-related predicted phosphoesterase